MKHTEQSTQQGSTLPQNCQRKYLNIYESYLLCKGRQYSQDRKDGFVSFALATNQRVAEQTRRYFPQFIRVHDCSYGDSKGSQFLRQFFVKGTKYTPDQCQVINSLEGLISALSLHKKVHYSGKSLDMEIIADHAEVTLTSNESCEVQFIEICKQEEIQACIEAQKQIIQVFIVPELSYVQHYENEKIFFILEHKFKEGFSCGICFNSSVDVMNDLVWKTVFMMMPSLLMATAEATIQNEHNQKLEEQCMDKCKNQAVSKENYIRTIQVDTGYRPKQDNFFWTGGVTGCVNNTAFSIFSKGDVVGIDSPFYFFLQHDLKKSGATFNFRTISKGTLLKRIKQSYASGQKGYLVVSPHNPTGKIFSEQQIKEVCQWGVQHPDYSLLFDEIYLKSIHSKNDKTMSIVQYADKYQNFFMIRGFAKDYGICGFKLGYLISCNKKIHDDFKRWQKVIRPQAYLINAVSRMLELSNYAQNIYNYNAVCLQESSNLIMNLLKKEGVEFIEPKSGIFLLIDLSEYMKENNQTEESIWTQLFFDYRVNISAGKNFKADKQGQFRICYLTSQQNIKEGIRRLGKFIRKEKMAFE